MSSLQSSAICAHCHKPFLSFNLPKQRYCSLECGGLARRRPVLERLMEKLKNTDDPAACWLWTGPINNSGYGQMAIPAGYCERTTKRLVHRLIWIEKNGKIKKGLCVLHRCDVRNCANPAHLFLGTLSENILDAIHKGRRAQPVWTKLTEVQVREIRAITNLSYTAIAERYGVSRPLVSLIMARKIWKMT